MRIIISKFSDWYIDCYRETHHPETVAIRNIISRNHQHSFILLGEGSRFQHYKADGVYFYNVGENSLTRYLFSFLLKFELACILRPSVIASLGTVNLIPVGLSSILTGAKFIPVITGEISYDLDSMHKPLRRILTLLLKTVFYKAHRILVLGESIRKNLINNYRVSPEKIFIYRYKVSEIFNSEVAKDLKASLNPNGPIVLTLCRISPEKGLEYLIEASKTVTEKFPNVKIIIKGSYGNRGSSAEKKYYGKLTELIRNHNLQQHISILEFSPSSEIPKYLSAADVFVLPSISEGLPLVILEALATGTPVVATRVGGIPDLLKNEKNSLLVNPGDIQGLSEAITRLLSESKLRKQITENGLKSTRGIGKNNFEYLLSKFMFKTKN